MKALKAVPAGLLALLIIAAPPYLLIRFIGNPWPPEGVSLDSPLTDNAILGLISVLVWILWAQFTVSLFVEAYAAIADKSVDVRLPVFGFQQDLARALVGAILSTVAITPIMAVAQPAAADPPRSTQAASSSTAWAQPTAHARAPAVAPTRRQQETKNVEVHVHRGDTLWSMAEKYLGDGDRWTEIAAANQGRTMVDGRVFTSADQIRTGWVLTMPGAVVDDHPSLAVPHTDYHVKRGDTLSSIAQEQLGDPEAYPVIFAASRGITQPGGQKLTDPDHIETAWTLSIPTDAGDAGTHAQPPAADPKSDQVDTGAEDRAPQDSTDGILSAQPPELPAAAARPAKSAQAEVPSAAPSPDAQTTALADVDAADGLADDESWPIMTRGGVGAVLAALLIGLLARRRAIQHRRRKPGERIPLPDGRAERVETETRTVAEQTGVEFVDQALGSLAAYTAATQHPLPQLQAARMTPQQLDLYLAAAPEHPLPAPWQATADPCVWIVPAGQRHHLSHVDPDLPALWPALVSVGHDAASGVILLNLAQLHGLAVTGDHHLTSQVMIALAIELGTAPWALDLDLTVIGSLVELADVLDRDRMRYVPTSHNVQFDPDRVHVVIAMSPLDSGQEQELRDRGATVVIQTPTTEGQHRGGWTIDLIDAEHATVQPIGLQINPQRVDSATYAAILDMLTASLATPTRPGHDQVLPFDRGHTRTPPAAPPRRPGSPPAPTPPGPLIDTAAVQPPSGDGGDSQAQHAGEHHMSAGNTLTTVRTPPEPPRGRVEPVTDHPAAAPSILDAGPELSEQELEDLAELRDIPPAELEGPAAADLEHEGDHNPAAGSLVATHAVADSDVAQHPMIRLLGPTVEIVGTTTHSPTSETHLRVCTRIATWLALNPGATRTALIEAIWNGRRVSNSTVDSRISQLRSWLGENPDDGQAYLPRRSLQFTDAVTTDWAQFIDLGGPNPTHATTEALEAAVRLIRGRPLEGEQSKHYGFAEYFAQDVIDVLADTTYELARRRYMSGQWRTAGSAAALGIRVDPGNERLWRLRIHAAHSAGDATSITEAIDRMHARITELGFDLDPETTDLLNAIATHDTKALAEERQHI